jgi:hypothetical protein
VLTAVHICVTYSSVGATHTLLLQLVCADMWNCSTLPGCEAAHEWACGPAAHSVSACFYLTHHCITCGAPCSQLVSHASNFVSLDSNMAAPCIQLSTPCRTWSSI